MRNFTVNNGWLASLISRLPGVFEEFPTATPILPPSPDEVALAYGAALLASGRYENAGAAILEGWTAVPEFYSGRIFYQQKIAPMFFAQYPPAEEFDATPPINTEARNDLPAAEPYPAGT